MTRHTLVGAAEKDGAQLVLTKHVACNLLIIGVCKQFLESI